MCGGGFGWVGAGVGWMMLPMLVWLEASDDVVAWPKILVLCGGENRE